MTMTMSGHIENLKAMTRQALGAMPSDKERAEFCDVMAEWFIEESAEWFLEESERVGQAEEEPN